MPDLQCVLVTPEKTLVDARADYVVLPLYDGELGVAPSHAPMIGRLGAGELRIRAGKETKTPPRANNRLNGILKQIPS